MSKKHNMSEEEFQRYLDRHQYDHPVEEETRKISEEISQSKEIFQDHKQHTKDVLRRIRRSSFKNTKEDFFEEFDHLEDLNYQHRKIRNNVKTHKQRIKEIKKHHQDID